MTGRNMRVVVATLLLLTVQSLLSGTATAQQEITPGADQGWTQTRWGALGPADRSLVEKVALAGLWEGPVAKQGSERGNSQIVRQTGAELHKDHAFLDQETVKIAGQLGIRLPDRPSEEQAGWMAEIDGKQGAEYDQVWTQRLRAAHGQIFQLIAQVRSGTRNDLMLGYAQTANKFVQKHMELLEKTGGVDFQALPSAELPGAAPAAAPSVDRASVTSTADGGLGMTIFFALLVITALAFGAITVFRRTRKANPSEMRSR